MFYFRLITLMDINLFKEGIMFHFATYILEFLLSSNLILSQLESFVLGLKQFHTKLRTPIHI